MFTPNVKVLPKNKDGRDFVIGDLHGCFEQLNMFMSFIEFDKDRDRMFSVGDLVDRGPENMKCIRLIQEPWFHSVLGNHEEMMIDYMFNTGSGSGLWWMRNGGNWFNYITNKERQELFKLIGDIKLPLMIEVQDSFRVLHAELPISMTEHAMTKTNEFNDVALRTSAEGGPNIIWGRSVFGNDYASIVRDWRGPTCGDLPIFCGHTPLQRHGTRGSFTNLDTMVFGIGRHIWAGLTVTEPKTNRFWKIDNDVREI